MITTENARRSFPKHIWLSLRLAAAVPALSHAQVAHDSAGVRILTVPEAAFQRYNPLRPEHVDVELGGAATPRAAQFRAANPLVSVAWFADSSIVVADMSALKFFDAAGEFQREIDLPTSVPGSFAQIGVVCHLLGDSVVVGDYATGKLAIWTRPGRLVRTIPGIGRAASAPCFSDGSLLVEAPTPPVLRGTRREREFQRVRSDGTVLNRLGPFPASEDGPIPQRVTVIAAGTNIIVGDAARGEARVYSLDGRLTSIVRVAGPTKEVTQEYWESAVHRMMPAGATEGDLRTLELQLESKRPQMCPAFRQVLADRSGRIWLQDFANPQLWRVVNENSSDASSVLLFGAGPAEESLIAVNGRRYALLQIAGGATLIQFYHLP